ncbi:MAG: efflux RND transporter periplasmic adaptor subunit [Deltaproteobacteria bacterium]|nr:efflux RND transporter periplasmic adaptor subunit [Deltaproteobacteria bacterium]
MQHRILFLFAIFMLFFLFACSEKTEPGTTTELHPVLKDVHVATVHMTDQPLIYEAVGTVRAGTTSNLAGKLLGTVKSIYVKEGDRVKQGDTLVIIDPRQVEAGLSMAEAGFSEAEKALNAAISARDAAHATERLALATYERYLNLKKEDSATAQEFDEVEARHGQAKAAMKGAEAMVEAGMARVRQAQAALVSARVTSQDAVITAPHDGIITGKLVDKGDLAAPGTPLLTLKTACGSRVDMVLPEIYINYVKIRQKVHVDIPALKMDPFQGAVSTIVPAADQRSRSFLIKISLPVDSHLKCGMFALVRIPIGHSSKILIPGDAVVFHGQLTGLYLVDSENIAHFRLIRMGRTFGHNIEVLSGLKEGDRYVTRPSPRLKDGARVDITS